MANQVILYDLPSQKQTCWSLNPWKTRAALNYKKIPYTTEWTEYPDLEPKLKSFGVPPNDPENISYPYSSPTIRLPDGRYVMDSRKIIEELEKLQPEPSLHIDNGYTDRTQKLLGSIFAHLQYNAIPLVPVKYLNPPSQEYFYRTRKVSYGMPLEEVAKCDKAGENAWKAADPNIKDLVAFLKENDGDFVAGKEISYADFVLGGMYSFIKGLDEKELHDRLFSYDPVFAKHEAAIAKYYERNDH